MPMKLNDILKEVGLFSNDIKVRMNNGNIKINGEPIKQNIELNVFLDSNDKLEYLDLGDFLFFHIANNQKWTNMVKFMGIETFFGDDCEINNDLSRYLKPYTLIKFSKNGGVVVKNI